MTFAISMIFYYYYLTILIPPTPTPPLVSRPFLTGRPGADLWGIDNPNKTKNLKMGAQVAEGQLGGPRLHVQAANTRGVLLF